MVQHRFELPVYLCADYPESRHHCIESSSEVHYYSIGMFKLYFLLYLPRLESPVTSYGKGINRYPVYDCRFVLGCPCAEEIPVQIPGALFIVCAAFDLFCVSSSVDRVNEYLICGFVKQACCAEALNSDE